MTNPEQDPDDALLDELLKSARFIIADEGFTTRLLASFDAHQSRRARLSWTLFADAFGWRALAQPLASAGFLAGLCAAGFVAGAASGPDDGETYAELAAAIDQSFDLNGEDQSWAEE